MVIIDLINSFYEAIDLFDSKDKLINTMTEFCNYLGISYFAIVHHTDPGPTSGEIIRLTNYPPRWVRNFDAQGLATRDPVHRASQLRCAGFSWAELPNLLPLTSADLRVLRSARREGLGDGYTAPFHVPGEHSGSCSFAVKPHERLHPSLFPLLQSLGAFAFEAARGLHYRSQHTERVRSLSRREHDCVVGLGHGMSEKEIARSLGISHSTVNGYLRAARARYGVHKSNLLLVHGLMEGSISYGELLGN